MVLPSPLDDQRDSVPKLLSMVFAGPWPSLLPLSVAEAMVNALLPVQVTGVIGSVGSVGSVLFDVFSNPNELKRPSLPKYSP